MAETRRRSETIPLNSRQTATICDGNSFFFLTQTIYICANGSSTYLANVISSQDGSLKQNLTFTWGFD